MNACSCTCRFVTSLCKIVKQRRKSWRKVRIDDNFHLPLMHIEILSLSVYHSLSSALTLDRIYNFLPYLYLLHSKFQRACMLRRPTSMLTAAHLVAFDLSFIVFYYLRSMFYDWVMSYGDVASERSRETVVGVN